MLRNYLKVAWRVLFRNRAFSLLNIAGLALGLACSLLILLWVKDERAMDGFHFNKDRLYLMYERSYTDGKVEGDYDAPSILGAELKKDFPEVQYAVTTDWDDTYTFRTEDKALKATGGFAGEDFFKIFSYRLLAGDAVSALNAPGRMAISKGMAVRFFGSPQAAMGKILHRDSVNKWKNFVVSAVFEENLHSSLRFDFLLSWHDYKIEFPWMQRWDNSGPHTMIVLKENAQPGLVREKIKGLLHSFNEHPIPGHRTELDMQRFDEHYLHNRFENGNPHGGRIAYVRLFSVVAVFILLIACINFMNLTTARSMQRAREIGVRKVIGAKRGALVGQFLSESIVLATAALIVALMLASMFLPLFNAITGKHMTVPMGEPGFWCQLLGLTLLTGCIAGSYPALYLSSFQPVKVLKGPLASVGGATLLRKGLVVVQFVLSTVLIIGTLVVSKQIDYMQTIDIGFQRENLAYIPLEGRLTEKYALFKQEALKLPGILSITSMTDAPTNLDNGTTNMDWDGKARDYIPSFTFTAVDYDYIRTMGIQLVAGRDFSTAFPTDSVGYILNEAALEKIGYKNPIGRNFTFWGRKGTIIGVVKNFHFASLHDPVSPLALRFRQDYESGNILVRIQRGQTPKALAGLETLCRQMNPGFPFTYQFSDQQYQRFYTSEIVVGQLSRCFAALAISISCLGLLGLALFTAEQRTKEIGIRKVLGAGVGRLFALLSKDLLVLVLLAFLIAAPLAWWAMSRWLADYSYHIPLGADVFIVAGLLAFLIAVATVSYHAVKTALANPVISLRSE